MARLRETIADLERQLHAVRSRIEGETELHAAVVRQQRQAEELARVARLVNETLDLTTVSERIAESVLGLLRVSSSAIRLLQPDGSLKALVLGGRARDYPANRETVPAGVGLVGRAAAEGRPMWTEDVLTDSRFVTNPELRERNAAFGIVSGVAVPLRVTGRVIGVLSVGNSTRRVFTEAEIDLLQTLADQAAIAISNAQNQEALAKQAERLRILHEIDRALLAEQAPEAIAEAAVRPLRELLGIPRVIVNIFDLEAGQVYWLAAAGRRRSYSGSGVRYSLSLAGDIEALKRGEPQLLDVDALPPSPEADALLASGVHVYMVVPMIAGGELIGSVSIGATAEPFPPEQVSIAQEAATQLAIAIAQARLHERVKRQAAELEIRVAERTRELRVATAEADRANQAKSEFLSRMSHELRTPLNAILGFSQLLELDAASPEQKDSVGHILRAGRHLLGLINEILDISRIEAGRLQLSLEPVPVHDTLRQAIDLVQPSAADAHVTVRAEAVDARVHVRADRQRLQQVLLNLLSNGVKYNRAGGTVTVVCVEAGGDRLRIDVTDTGHGISADKLARLFTPFDRLGRRGQRGRGDGTGAGPVENAGRGDGRQLAGPEPAGGGLHVFGGTGARAGARAGRGGGGAEGAGSGGGLAARGAEDSVHRGQPLESRAGGEHSGAAAGDHGAVGDAGPGGRRSRAGSPAGVDPAGPASAGHPGGGSVPAPAGGPPDTEHPGDRAERGRDAVADAAVPGRRGAGLLDQAAGRAGAPGRDRRGSPRRAPGSVLTS